MTAKQPDRKNVVLLLGLMVLLGCGPSTEQEAVDAYNRGVAYEKKGEKAKAEEDFAQAKKLRDPKG